MNTVLYVPLYPSGALEVDLCACFQGGLPIPVYDLDRLRTRRRVSCLSRGQQ